MFSLLIIISSYLLKTYSITFIACNIIIFLSVVTKFLLVEIYKNAIYGSFLPIFTLSRYSSYPYFLVILILALCGDVMEVLNNAFASLLKILFLYYLFQMDLYLL